MVKLTPTQQKLFLRAHPTVFMPVTGGWGLKGATNVKLRVATVAILRPALEAAWKNVAPSSLVAAAFNRTTKWGYGSSNQRLERAVILSAQRDRSALRYLALMSRSSRMRLAAQADRWTVFGGAL
jgi:hypothetical protein